MKNIFTFDYNLFLKQTEIHLDKPAALLILSNMIEARPISSNFEDQERADLIAAVDKFLTNLCYYVFFVPAFGALTW